MRRGRLLTCLVFLMLGAAGCATPTTAGDPAPAPSPGAVGLTPAVPLNPSDPPGGQPIATGVRVGDSALLLWFGRSDADIGLDGGWYDVHTGKPAAGPGYTMGWFPTEPVPDCFQDLGEMTLPDGELLDVGWLIGDAAAVVMTQGPVTAAAAVAHWAPDSRRVVFWIQRHGRPLTERDTTLTPDIPVFTATDAHGARLCRQPFTAPDIHPRTV